MKFFNFVLALFIGVNGFAADLKTCDLNSTQDSLKLGAESMLHDAYMYIGQSLDINNISVQQITTPSGPALKVEFVSPTGTRLSVRSASEEYNWVAREALYFVFNIVKERDSDGLLTKKTCVVSPFFVDDSDKGIEFSPKVINELNGEIDPITKIIYRGHNVPPLVLLLNWSFPMILEE